MSNWLRNDPNVRDQIYTIAIAVVGLAVVYGLVSESEAAAWLALAAAVISAGANVLAKKNVK